MSDERRLADEILPMVRVLERLTYYDTIIGYHRAGDVANGAQTREIMLKIRGLLRDESAPPVEEPLGCNHCQHGHAEGRRCNTLVPCGCVRGGPTRCKVGGFGWLCLAPMPCAKHYPDPRSLRPGTPE